MHISMLLIQIFPFFHFTYVLYLFVSYIFIFILRTEEGRAMKSLTNTGHNSDCGRTRRRAAPVSYKEPAINW